MRRRYGDECASPLRMYRYTGSLLEYDCPVPYAIYFYFTVQRLQTIVFHSLRLMSSNVTDFFTPLNNCLPDKDN